MSVAIGMPLLAMAFLLACGSGAAMRDPGEPPPPDVPGDVGMDLDDPSTGSDDGTSGRDLPVEPTDAFAELGDGELPDWEPDIPPPEVPIGEVAVELPADPGPDPPADDGPPPFPPPVAAGCVTHPAAGVQRIPCNGLVHDVLVPKACLTRPCGVVLDIHGLTMDAAMQDRNTGMRALGRQHGYIVVQPNANPAPPASSWKTGEDDAKVLAFLSDLEAAFHPDPARIHATGFSQGGLMTWRFLCNHPERFASLAIGSACSYPTQVACSFSGDEVPPGRIPLLYMHGEKDVIYLFAAAEAQRDAVARGWSLREDATLSQDAGHRWTRWIGDGGEVFEFVQHAYKAKSEVLRGHCYPGSTDPGGLDGQLFSFACEDASAFAWGRIAMDFFLAHPRRP